LNNHLEIFGIIVTYFDKRNRSSKEILEIITENFPKKVFKTNVRVNVSLAEAPSFGQSILKYAPKSHGAEDYYKISKEIINRG